MPEKIDSLSYPRRNIGIVAHVDAGDKICRVQGMSFGVGRYSAKERY